MRWLSTFLLLLLLPSLCWASLYRKGPMTVEAFIENQSAIKPDFSRYIKVMNIFDVRAQFKPNDHMSFFGHIHKYQDQVYNIEDEYSDARHRMISNRAPFEGDSWIRELYLDIFTDLVDLRIGKQIITWGSADGIRVLDAFINPLNWRELTLRPWNEMKIPLWMLKAEVAPTLNGSLQFFFIPDFEPEAFAQPGSPYAFRMIEKENNAYLSLENLGYRVDVNVHEPSQNIRNTKYGIRWRDIVGNMEYTLNILYGWDTLSTVNSSFFDTSTASMPPLFPPYPPGMHPLGSTFRVEKRYKRIWVFGGSFSKTFVSSALKGLTVRGEFAYVDNKVVTYLDDLGKLHQRRVDRYSYVIGLDKYLITNWLFSFQFIQTILSQGDENGHSFILPSGGIQHKVTNYYTLKVSTDFFHERLKPDVLILYGDRNQWRISPRFPFEWNDHITTTLGAHILEGRSSTYFGEFKHEKQLYFEFKYSF